MVCISEHNLRGHVFRIYYVGLPPRTGITRYTQLILSFCDSHILLEREHYQAIKPDVHPDGLAVTVSPWGLLNEALFHLLYSIKDLRLSRKFEIPGVIVHLGGRYSNEDWAHS
jgi:hypothetical protein